MNKPVNDTKKVFREKGTCSQTLCFLLNRSFGFTQEDKEMAADPLTGGLMQTGHQCGMLWGASLASGAESSRRCSTYGMACALAISATSRIMQSFVVQTGTHNCREITGCDFSRFTGMIRYIIKILQTGMSESICFNLAERWVPEAILAAQAGLTSVSQKATNCASEVLRKMGACEEDAVMVAGFAGGLGLSGNACGALAAALWMNTLTWIRKNPGKKVPYFRNTTRKKIMKKFYDETGSQIRCSDICGRTFKSIADHSAFIENGGCSKLITILAQS